MAATNTYLRKHPVTVNPDNTVEVSFLGDGVIPVVSTSTEGFVTDIFVGELGNDEVLIVQHHQGEVVSITQTIYDENGNVVPVSTAFPGPRSVESVVNNASGTDCSIRRTCGIETSAILHFYSVLTMRELCLQNSGSNSSTRTGYAVATNTSWRKHRPLPA